jgi:hypothetical protein
MAMQLLISHGRRTKQCSVLLLLAAAAFWLTPNVIAEEGLEFRLLSHLQEAAGEEVNPAPRSVRPRRPRTLTEDLQYAGPPAAIDGPDSASTPRLAPWEEAEALPAITGILPDDMLEYPADGPIAMEHPLLGDPVLRDGMARLSSHRNGFFQKLSLTGTWVHGGNDPQDFGFTEIDAFASFAIPFPITAWPLVITPGYNMHLLTGPESPDLPARLNDAYVDFMWLPTIINRYTLLLAVTPGYYSDFQVQDADAFRVTGKGLLIFDAIPDRLQLVGGVIYLGRDNLKLLPVGGAIWNPTDFLRLELIFPKPKLAVCVNSGYGFEDWIYTTAEYGGNTYSVERTSGDHDKVTLQDYRVLLGLERKLDGGAGYMVEAGYVFSRRVTYLSGGGFEPGDTFLLRAGIVF